MKMQITSILGKDEPDLPASMTHGGVAVIERVGPISSTSSSASRESHENTKVDVNRQIVRKHRPTSLSTR